MSRKVPYSPAVIGDLRTRVAAHNQDCPERQVRLGELKSRYGRYYQGATPHDTALAKIDTWLGTLAKAGGHFDAEKHPRGHGGEFTGTGRANATPVSITVAPTTDAEHAQEQEDNPTYRALTSDVIEDHRHQFAAATLRSLASYGLGAALVASAYRGRAGGLVSRAVPWAAGNVARWPTEALAGGLARGGTLAAHASHAALNRALRRPEPAAPSFAGAKRFQRKAGDVAERAGRAVAIIPARGFPMLVRTAVKGLDMRLEDAAPGASLGRRAGVAAKRIAIRGGALGGLALGTGATINSAWVNSPLPDPERIGASWDAVSYRTIQKALATGDLAKLADNVRADVLAKAGPKFLNAGFPALAMAGIGALGAAGGAAAAHPLRRGNPYRDSHGRFASKSNAVSLGAAAAGAALGALSIFAMVRGHNQRRFATVGKALLDHLNHQRAMLSDEGTLLAASNHYEKQPEPLANLFRQSRFGKLADLVRNREKLSQEMAAGDETTKDRLAELDRYGAANPAHYKAEIADAVNSRLTNFLSQVPAFRIPGAKKGTWIGMDELNRNAANSGIARAQVRASIAKMDAAQFDQATEGLSDAQKEQVRGLFGQRQGWIDGAEQALTKHRADIEAAAKTVSDAELALNDAKALKTAATTAKDQKTATAAVVQAQKAFDDATRAHDALKERALMMSPVDPTTALPSFDHRAAIQSVKQEALKAARIKVRANEDELRDAIRSDVERKHDRMTAAMVHMAPGAAGPARAGAADRVARAAVALRDVESDAADAAGAHAKMKALAKDLAVARAGGVPKGMTEVQAQALRDRGEKIKADLAAAKARETDSRGAVASARGELAEAVSAFHAGAKSAKGSPRLSKFLSARMVRSLQQAGGKSGSTFAKFVAYPTLKHFRAFLAWSKQHAATMAQVGKRSVTSGFKAAVMRGEGDQAHVDPFKLAGLIGGPVGIGVASEAAKDLYNFGKTKLSGTPEERRKARITKVKFDQQRDPLTGAGYHALTVAHPDRKDDRLVLFGEHFQSGTAKTQPIFAGSSVAELRQRLAQQRQQGAPGAQAGPAASAGRIDLASMKPEDKKEIDAAIGELKSGNKLRTVKGSDGVDLSFRADDDQSKQSESQRFGNFIRNAFLANGSPKGRAYFDALAATVHSHQGRVLRVADAYPLLTQHKQGGAKTNGNGIFSYNADFGSTDKGEVAQALAGEVEHALTNHKLHTELQRHALLSAVATVGAAKDLAPDRLAPLYRKIKEQPLVGQAGASAAPAASASAPNPRPQTAASSAPRPDPDMTLKGAGANWHQATFDREAQRIATQVATADLGYERADQIKAIVPAIRASALYVSKLHPHLTMEQSLEATEKAIRKGFNDGGAGQRMLMQDALEDPKTGMKLMHELLWEEGNKLGKRAPAVSELRKLLHDAADDVAAGLEPLAKDASDLANLGREVADGAVDYGAQVATQPKRARGSRSSPWYSPGRIVPELGSFLVGDTAGYVAQHLLGPAGKIGSLTLDAVAPRLLGQTGSKLAATGVRRAVKGAATGVASVGATAASGAALRAATGSRAVAPHDTPNEAIAGGLGSVLGDVAGAKIGSIAAKKVGGALLGRLAATGVGRLLGGTAGSALGPAGTVIGGAVGGWALQHLAESATPAIERYFGGYDKGTAHSAMARYTAPAPRPPSSGARPISRGQLSAGQIQERRVAARARWAQDAHSAGAVA